MWFCFWIDSNLNGVLVDFYETEEKVKLNLLVYENVTLEDEIVEQMKKKMFGQHQQHIEFGIQIVILFYLS